MKKLEEFMKENGVKMTSFSNGVGGTTEEFFLGEFRITHKTWDSAGARRSGERWECHRKHSVDPKTYGVDTLYKAVLPHGFYEEGKLEFNTVVKLYEEFWQVRAEALKKWIEENAEKERLEKIKREQEVAHYREIGVYPKE